MTLKNELRKTLKKLFRCYTEQKYEKALQKLYKQKEYEKTVNKTSLDIAFIIPEVEANSGGHRNIFRAVKKLDEYGHKLTVYIYGSKYLNEQKFIINKNFNDMRYVDIKLYSEKNLTRHDVCICTWCETFYLMYKHKELFKQMFYFVQDFEPWFYLMGTKYFLAENTYKMGVPCITSGPWLAKYLPKKYGTEANEFLFPLDKSVYNTDKPRTKDNRNIVFFARPEMQRRCYELGVKTLEIVKQKRPDIEVIFYGSTKINPKKIPFEITCKHSLPTINDLADLYRNADLGICFSTTNPSLVPYEMMACGLPVVDMDVNEAEYKYGSRDNVFLFDTLPEVMAEQIVSVMDNDNLRKKVAKNGYEYSQHNFISEEEMGRRIESLILDKFKQNTEV